MSNYIYGQCSEPVADLRYGRLHRTVAQAGCGAVALYNARIFLGKPVAFEELLREMDRLKMPWLFGLCGTKPLSLRRYLRRNKIPFQNYFSLRRLTDALTNGHLAIVCAWNPRFRGIHFYCVFPQDGQLQSLNYVSCGCAQPFSLDCLSPLRFLVGYLL